MSDGRSAGWSAAAWERPAGWDAALQERLDPAARQAWQQLHARVTAADDPVRALTSRFPGVARAVGRAPLAPPPPGDLEPVLALHGGVDDLARAVLVRDVAPAGPALRELYDLGDAAERRGVLRGLAALPGLGGPDGADLVADALRTNDVRLVAASVGPCAAHLDAVQWRQAVLKCLFVGVPLEHVADLERRRDDALAAMAARYVAERVAAGRPVPVDVPAVLPAGHPALAQARLDDPCHAAYADRRAAAAAARALLDPHRHVTETT
ncbi:EboA domain-containing protein [Aquipuribacter nitratireducens]|uniref:EboA domain-containing protein n=1 Tax=Aquipuribacter nitratireducens TaxID=650104 RepID=A0ABW0GJ36_9MICO